MIFQQGRLRKVGMLKVMAVDEVARNEAITRYGLAENLHVPIAAVDEAAISSYIGTVRKILNGGALRKALLVELPPPPARDLRFPIWDVGGSDILHQRMQVWVDVTYSRYRRA